jgi:hypothetical protein
MACPTCGGSNREAIAPGWWRCRSDVISRIPGPGYGAPPTGQFGPEWIDVAVPCGSTYAEGIGQGPIAPACSCGTFAIGICEECGEPVCGECSGMYGGKRIHDRHALQRVDAQRQQETENARRESEKKAAEHRRAIDAYESAHGGHDYLDSWADEIKRGLAAHPGADQSISEFGVLFLGFFAALICGAIFGGVAGIVIAEVLTIGLWTAWVLARRQEASHRRRLLEEEDRIARQRGCGNINCRECYPDTRDRGRLAQARSAVGQETGCGVLGCGACYPSAA